MNFEIKSVRVFLWLIEKRVWAFARSKEGSWVLSSSSKASGAIRRLDTILPQSEALHVFASPFDWPEELFLRDRKLLKISMESRLPEYAEILEFIAAGLPSDLELQEQHVKCLEKLTDKELEKLLRTALRSEAKEILCEKDAVRWERLVAKANQAPKMLLHVCCGPDAAGVIHQLKEEYDLTCFWYDPNIQPKQEYDLRLEAFVRVSEIEGVPFIIGEYDVGAFYRSIEGLESTPEQGAKCSKCYDMRLERAAVEARNKGFDLYATTLAISPHKVQSKLIAFGELNERRYGVEYHHRNFMKSDGFKRSVELTETYGIYRQDYCGCYFSLHEGGPAARWLHDRVSVATNSSPQERPGSLPKDVFESYQTRLKETEKLGGNSAHKG